jgi:septum formation protein
MSAAKPDFIYLASASPRRRELLRQLGVDFRVLTTAVDERLKPGERADAYVMRLAASKAQAGWKQLAAAAQAPVLGADTTVIAGGEVLGKPVDREEAVRMLTVLSGTTHVVLTGIALLDGRGMRQRCSRSEVTFRAVDAAEAGAYWDTGEPRDKAGGYAIQGFGAVFVRHLSGSFSGVMGLPLFETAELLSEAQVPRWRRL